MKLAEALIQRSDLQKKLEVIKERISSSILVQEGDEPIIDSKELFQEYENILREYEELVIKINKTNSITDFNEEMKISDALVKRDVLLKKKEIYERAINEGSIRQDRYTRSEIKYVPTVDMKKIQGKLDLISKEYRKLDTKIQGLNWTIDLV